MKEYKFCVIGPSTDRIEYHEYEKDWGAYGDTSGSASKSDGFSDNGSYSPKQLRKDLSDPTKPIMITSGKDVILLRTKTHQTGKRETRAVFMPEEGNNAAIRSMRSEAFDCELERLGNDFSPQHDVFTILEEITRFACDQQGVSSKSDAKVWIDHPQNESN